MHNLKAHYPYELLFLDHHRTLLESLVHEEVAIWNNGRRWVAVIVELLSYLFLVAARFCSRL